MHGPGSESAAPRHEVGDHGRPHGPITLLLMVGTTSHLGYSGRPGALARQFAPTKAAAPGWGRRTSVVFAGPAYFIAFAFARASSRSPTYRNACSGRSSASPF